MAIAFTCECGKKLRVEDEDAGPPVICPACRREVVIQQPLAEAHVVPPAHQSFPAIWSEAGETEREKSSGVVRPSWKNRAIVIAATTSSGLAVLVALLAWGAGPPRLDASTEESLKRSMQEMTSRMTDDQKREFSADCMAVALPDMMKSAFQRAFLRNKPVAANQINMFKSLQGMNATEIHVKAEAARRALQEAQNGPSATTSAQPLPGVPAPVEALAEPSVAQPNAKSLLKRETADTDK